MFHVKQTINKTFDAQPLKEGCIKCFAVKVKLQQFVKQKQIKSTLFFIQLRLCYSSHIIAQDALALPSCSGSKLTAYSSSLSTDIRAGLLHNSEPITEP